MNLGMSLALGSASRSAGVPSYSPLSLFGASEQGVWYDPSDFSTMYQDNLGVTPVTAVGQTVGRIEDKSGNGNHATQATAASRPILGRVPFGGRRNLLTYTEQFDNVVWKFSNPGTTTVVDQSSAPNGTTTADELREDTSTGNHRMFGYSTAWTTTTGVAYVFSIYVKANGRTKFNMIAAGIGSGTINFDLVAETAGSGGSIASVGDGWYRCSITGTSPSGGLANPILNLRDDSGAVSYTGDGTSGIYLWGAQLETGSTATAYQRVTTALDVTEAGVADCYYLSFDGTDDFMLTGNIDFSATDEVTVVAGVRKLSDAAAAAIVELSASSANPGSFSMRSPDGAGLARTTFASAGSISVNLAGTQAAPVTSVVTGLADISENSLVLRFDGSQVATSAADQGTGDYGTYPLYIGRRGGTSLPFNGHIHSLIVRGLTTAGTDLTDAETYVAGKTGVTL